MRTLLISVAISLFIGFGLGYAFHSNYICPDMNKAIVKQMKEDADKLTQVKKEVQIKYVYRDKIKTVIKNAPADECLDTPIPDDVANGVLDAFSAP